VLAAWRAGAPGRGPGDALVPPVEAYVADFRGVVAAPALQQVTATRSVMSEARMADLTANGWPCHGRLGADLERVEGRLQAEGAVSLVYTDGAGRLELHEQTGALDAERLRGFEQQVLGGREVWVRATGPERVVAWDADGVVFTVVTDVGDARLVPALQDLPAPTPEPGVRERIGHGMERLSDWVSV
jgi:hypothetical protein